MSYPKYSISNKIYEILKDSTDAKDKVFPYISKSESLPFIVYQRSNMQVDVPYKKSIEMASDVAVNVFSDDYDAACILIQQSIEAMLRNEDQFKKIELQGIKEEYIQEANFFALTAEFNIIH